MKFKLTVIGGGGDCMRELEAFERHVAKVMEPFECGASVQRFELCLELSTRLMQKDWYASLRRYNAWRARLRTLFAVAQLDESVLETCLHPALSDAIVEAAQRTDRMGGLPKDFAARRFRDCVRDAARSWQEVARLERSE